MRFLQSPSGMTTIRTYPARARTRFFDAIKGLAVWVGSVVLIKAAEEQQVQPASSSVEEGGKGNGEGGNSVSVAHAKTKYAMLAEESMGGAGPYIIDSVIAVQNGGAVCSYVVILGGLATSLLSGLLEWLEVIFPFESFRCSLVSRIKRSLSP